MAPLQFFPLVFKSDEPFFVLFFFSKLSSISSNHQEKQSLANEHTSLDARVNYNKHYWYLFLYVRYTRLSCFRFLFCPVSETHPTMIAQSHPLIRTLGVGGGRNSVLIYRCLFEGD